MLGKLVIIEGPDSGRDFPLTDGQTIQIGRGPSTQTRLTDPFVSRLHCQVTAESGIVTLVDLGGAGGTFVNEKKVTQPQLLHSNDIIGLGDTRFQVQLNTVHDQGTVVRPKEPDTGPMPTFLPGDISQLAGQKLDKFQVERLIARGQCGFVFAAVDSQNNQQVALKVLHPEFTSHKEDLQRILRGVQTALPLRHPNLVSVLGTGQRGPYCWVAMEYVEGESMMQIIQRIGIANILDWRYALRMSIHVGRALDYLHSQGIVHRNITPTNILVESKENLAKLSDVMLAKSVEGTQAQQQITRPGQIVGELAYMSPERTVDSRKVDGRSDIYGLGATVYALLTGQPPCQGKTQVETVEKIRTQEPSSPRAIQLSIPEEFEKIVLRMLVKRREDRYQAVSQLVKELEEIAREQRVTV